MQLEQVGGGLVVGVGAQRRSRAGAAAASRSGGARSATGRRPPAAGGRAGRLRQGRLPQHGAAAGAKPPHASRRAPRRAQEPPRLAEGGKPPPPGWPASGTLTYTDVWASYRPGLPPVLKRLSFSLPGGCSCGVVGRTGSGKSSLMLTLFRLISVDAGTITLDGLDTAGLALDVLRRQLAIIPQDPVRGHGSGDTRGRGRRRRPRRGSGPGAPGGPRRRGRGARALGGARPGARQRPFCSGPVLNPCLPRRRTPPVHTQVLFSGTLRSNLDPWNRHSDAGEQRAPERAAPGPCSQKARPAARRARTPLSPPAAARAPGRRRRTGAAPARPAPPLIVPC